MNENSDLWFSEGFGSVEHAVSRELYHCTSQLWLCSQFKLILCLGTEDQVKLGLESRNVHFLVLHPNLIFIFAYLLNVSIFPT